MKNITVLILLLLFIVTPLTKINAQTLVQRVSGRLLLQVEQGGAIWYVYPENNNRYSITFANAMAVFENLALGISNTDLAQIPLGSDDWTSAIGARLKGRLLLQVEAGGAIWYIDLDGKRWSVTWNNLMTLFESLSLGITDVDLSKIQEMGVERLTDDEIDSDDSLIAEDRFDEEPWRSMPVMGLNEKADAMEVKYCDYAESYSKLAIIIKEGGFFDNTTALDKFDIYFQASEGNTGIENVGVKKFYNTSLEELDEFIENLVKNEHVGYVMLIGSDLPILEFNESDELMTLNEYGINEDLSYVGRRGGMDDLCADIAISSVIEPLLIGSEKMEFLEIVFDKFIDYHENTDDILETFSDSTIIISQDYGEVFNLATGEREGKLFTTNYTYFEAEQNEEIQNEYENYPLYLHYRGHGSENLLAIGLTDKEYSDFSNLTNWTGLHNHSPFLFANVGACMRGMVENNHYDGMRKSWPQVMLESGVWNYYSVASGSPYTFEYWFRQNKIFGKALRKTKLGTHHYIYGDILAVNPY